MATWASAWTPTATTAMRSRERAHRPGLYRAANARPVVVPRPGNGTVGYCALKSSAATAASPALTLRATTRAASARDHRYRPRPRRGPGHGRAASASLAPGPGSTSAPTWELSRSPTTAGSAPAGRPRSPPPHSRPAAAPRPRPSPPQHRLRRRARSADHRVSHLHLRAHDLPQHGSRKPWSTRPTWPGHLRRLGSADCGVGAACRCRRAIHGNNHPFGVLRSAPASPGLTRRAAGL